MQIFFITKIKKTMVKLSCIWRNTRISDIDSVFNYTKGILSFYCLTISSILNNRLGLLGRATVP